MAGIGSTPITRRAFIGAAAAATASMVLSGCASAPNSTEGGSGRQEAGPDLEALRDAYTFCFPLMMVDATCTKMTNAVTASSRQAPIGQLIHAQALANARFSDVVTPNVDTVYSQLFLDLSENVQLLTLPRTDRFCNAEVMDAYSNCVVSIDCTTFDSPSKTFAFVQPGSAATIGSDEAPDAERIECPTSLVWLLIRTLAKGDDDLPNVYAIQNAMSTCTLDAYRAGTPDAHEDGTYDEANDFVPIDHVRSMDCETFFTRANELMALNPPSPADAEMVERMAAAGVGAGLEFDVAGVTADDWKQIVEDADARGNASAREYSQANGCWTYFGEPIAEFGTAYDYRYIIAVRALAANPVSVAIYPKAQTTDSGERLNGANRYVVHFDQAPETLDFGFWSMTAYDSSNDLLIDNELDRYCINDRSEIVTNPDGSFDVYLQRDKPTDEVELANWLPVCDGDFHLHLRVYNPTGEIVANEWKAPSITLR